MYSLEQRTRAVELYIKYGFKATATIRELGYPSRAQLVGWYREWQDNGGALRGRNLERYSEGQRRAAVNHYLEHGRCNAYTRRELGYPGSTQKLREWIDELAPGELPGKARLYYCDPMQSQQKGACERNHIEVRKLLPKGRGVRFDLLTRADCALLMSQVNSEPRGSLAWMSPVAALRAAFGIEELGTDELDLTPGCIERARRERGEAPLS